MNSDLFPYFSNEFKHNLICVRRDAFVVCFDESLNKVVQRGQMDIFIQCSNINTH